MVAAAFRREVVQGSERSGLRLRVESDSDEVETPDAATVRRLRMHRTNRLPSMMQQLEVLASFCGQVSIRFATHSRNAQVHTHDCRQLFMAAVGTMELFAWAV
jgi:hypothetical protein